MGWSDDAFIPRKEERAGEGSVTRASTVGPEPSPWPASKRAVGCKKCAAQSKQGGCSLLHLAPPGSGPGWLVRQAAGVGGLGGPATPCPRFVFGRCALHSGPRLGPPRAPGREAKFNPECRSISGCVATGPSGQASGHRGPALRSPGRQERAQWGLGRSARRRRSLGPGHAPYLAGGGRGGGASECFLMSSCYTWALSALLPWPFLLSGSYSQWQGCPAARESACAPKVC